MSGTCRAPPTVHDNDVLAGYVSIALAVSPINHSWAFPFGKPKQNLTNLWTFGLNMPEDRIPLPPAKHIINIFLSLECLPASGFWCCWLTQQSFGNAGTLLGQLGVALLHRFEQGQRQIILREHGTCIAAVPIVWRQLVQNKMSKCEKVFQHKCLMASCKCEKFIWFLYTNQYILFWAILLWVCVQPWNLIEDLQCSVTFSKGLTNSFHSLEVCLKPSANCRT